MRIFVHLFFHNCHISLSAGQERMLSAQSALVVVLLLCAGKAWMRRAFIWREALNPLQNVSRCSKKACVELYMLTVTVLADTDAN